MDEGCRLALEKSDQVGFFGSTSIFGFNLSPRLTNKNKGLIMFLVNSSGKEEHEEMPTGSQQKAVLGEVDFFSVKSKPVNNVNATMKKEVPHVEASTRMESDVNPRFQLFRRVFPVCLRKANLSRPIATSFDRLLDICTSSSSPCSRTESPISTCVSCSSSCSPPKQLWWIHAWKHWVNHSPRNENWNWNCSCAPSCGCCYGSSYNST